MKYTEYSELAKQRIREVVIAYDLAVSSYKLLIGNHTNESPFLTSQNCDISKCKPFILGHSEHFGSMAELINSHGKKLEHHSVAESKYSRDIPDWIISKLAILDQYSLLEDYEFSQYDLVIEKNIEEIDTQKYTLKDVKNRGYDNLRSGVVQNYSAQYQRESVSKRIKTKWTSNNIQLLNEDLINLYQAMGNRRNELTHDINHFNPHHYPQIEPNVHNTEIS
jgi:hypothetical protein